MSPRRAGSAILLRAGFTIIVVAFKQRLRVAGCTVRFWLETCGHGFFVLQLIAFDVAALSIPSAMFQALISCLL